MYAVKNGHSPVAAYLLRIGVNPCAADTSGNTPVHYAAAYGWLHCLKMLIKAGGDPNAANQWKASILHMSDQHILAVIVGNVTESCSDLFNLLMADMVA